MTLLFKSLAHADRVASGPTPTPGTGHAPCQAQSSRAIAPALGLELLTMKKPNTDLGPLLIRAFAWLGIAAILWVCGCLYHGLWVL